jgi:ABC-2 type transport system permease protein
MRSIAATFRSSIAEAAANRRALLFQMGVMIANDGMWIAFWLLFFRAAGTVRGWDADRVLVLLAVLTTAGGITLGLISNARHLGTRVLDGSLDATLSLPVSTLAHLLARRIEPVNLGDLVFGIGLFAVAGNPTPTRTAVFVITVLAAAVLMTSFLVLVGSLSFFLGRNDGGDLGFHALLLTSSYPVDLFGGAAKIVLYTVVPSAFVSSVPSRLIDDWSAGLAVGLLAVTVAFAVGAVMVFHAGVRRYASSGSGWTRA